MDSDKSEESSAFLRRRHDRDSDISDMNMHRELGLGNQRMDESINFTNSSVDRTYSKAQENWFREQGDSEYKYQKKELERLKYVYDASDEEIELPHNRPKNHANLVGKKRPLKIR